MENSLSIARVYRGNWRVRAIPLLCLALGSVWVASYFAGELPEGPFSEDIGPAPSIVLLVCGVILAVHVFTKKAILSDDAFEVRSIFYRRRLLFSEIRGRRESVAGDGPAGGRILKLEPKSGKARSLTFNDSFGFDDLFYAWFYQIPSLDEEGKADPCA